MTFQLFCTILASIGDAFIRKKVVNQTLDGIRASKCGLKISHLLFTNNSFLFSKSTLEEYDIILECMKIYKDALSQKVNLQKLGILFNLNTHLNVREEIQNKFHVHIAKAHDKYLGLPVIVKKKSFSSNKRKNMKEALGMKR